MILKTYQHNCNCQIPRSLFFKIMAPRYTKTKPAVRMPTVERTLCKRLKEMAVNNETFNRYGI